MLDHARNGVEAQGKGSWIGNAAKRCIENLESAIASDTARHPYSRSLSSPERPSASAARRNGDLGRPTAEDVDLVRQGEAPQRLGPAWRRRRSRSCGSQPSATIFSRNSAPPRLDEVQRGIELVSAVHDQIEFRRLGRDWKRNAERAAERGRAPPRSARRRSSAPRPPWRRARG